MNAKKQRMKELIEILDKAAKAYYADSAEIMSNAEYDELYDELENLEKETGIVLAGSLTKKVGYEVLSSLPKKAHKEPRLSLAKTKEVAELESFLGDKEGILMWKLDGLTIVLTYENGELVEALTRGNGEIGEVVTENARFFENIPLVIPYKGSLMVRGEAIIKYSDFNRINDEITDVAEKYKNPRNLCSGSVRQLSTEVTASRNINFIVYEDLEGGEKFKTRVEELNYLESLGFTVVDHPLVTRDSIEAEVRTYEKRIKSYDIPSDGLVLQFNDIAYGNSLGKTAKFPRHSIAFKWKDETAETILREIEWSASRTGLINPVAIFDPVELEGTTVTRASVHNVSIMRGLKLGVGDKIKVYKANMIIPQILENLTGSDAEEVPEFCPVCGGKTELKDEEGVQTLYCTNPDCMAKKIKLLTHFVSRDAMNIAGLSEMTLEKFVGENMIHELSDVFKLSGHREKIVSLEGFGEKSYNNLIESIDKARETTAVRVLYSLGIANIGLATAKLICRFFDNDIERITKAKPDELTQIDGVGEVMAGVFADYFNKDENLRTLEHLLLEVHIENAEANANDEGSSEGSNTISGLTFVVTGDVEKFKNRRELSDFIESKGGKVTGSVTGKTDYLINNDLTSNSGKNKKAKELGIKIISENEFLELVGGSNAD
ncbi:NAD-dependent DNA ligase LigA [Catonella massiliensis]|uniref:DNA ligase n=1 Tax=Catonella massiliensis TaxID=2799636 RepID=A0ABS1IYQ4_9FIRM|nr:NAD-dependent DNA ligase LigA [Catonella massiliensis]MBK5896860.1 NAD-dependent DNA ligase LigA [Catonella massiliensis]